MNFNEQLVQLTQLVQNGFANLGNELANQKNGFANLGNELANQKNGFANLGNELVLLKNGIANLGSEQANQKNGFANIENELVFLKNGFANLGNGFANLGNELAIFKNEVRNDLAVLKNDIAVLKNDIAIVKNDLSILAQLSDKRFAELSQGQDRIVKEGAQRLAIFDNKIAQLEGGQYLSANSMRQVKRNIDSITENLHTLGAIAKNNLNGILNFQLIQHPLPKL
ncbi:hypothetical protein ABPG72_013256 [Tetrahymena utriculariae]